MKLFLASIFVLSPVLLNGQSFNFPFNEQGKVEYYYSIYSDSTTLPVKKANTLKYYHSIGNAPYDKSGDNNYYDEFTGNFSKKTGFILYESGLITKKPSGVITGNCRVVVLDSGYQVFISELKYSDLIKDRYGVYNPASSKFFPIESLIDHHSGKKWDQKYHDINDKIQGIISKSRLFLVHQE
jgi:hypothetical protein